MNKAELVEKLAKKTKESKTVCRNVLEAFMDTVGEELKKNRQVVLTSFGSFSVMKRKARTGVNPSTGKKMEIPAKKVPKFKPGKSLRTVLTK